MAVQHKSEKHVKWCPECDELERQAADGLALAEAVLKLSTICGGSGPIAPCFDEDDYITESQRGAWSTIDQRELDALKELACKVKGGG